MSGSKSIVGNTYITVGRPTGYSSYVTTGGGLDVSGILYCSSGCILNTNNPGGLLLNLTLSGYGAGYWGYIGNSGLQIGWNSISSGYGTTDFLSNGQGGAGGFIFATTSSSSTGISPQMTIRPGAVGIGTTNPSYPLHVAGGAVGTIGGGWYFNYNMGTVSAYSTALQTVAIYTTNYVVSNGFLATSDKRIKTNIVDIDDISALETLRLIQPKRYSYIDVVTKGSQPVWGFIAQQIREVLPYSTTLVKDFIPNIYEIATVSNDGLTVTLTNKSTTDISLNDLSGTMIRFININNKDVETKIDQIIDDKNFTVKTAFEQTDLSDNKIFVYGQQVDDFHTLDKTAIFTIATAALQEVDRDLQSNIATVQTQQQQIQDLETRLSALEARLSAAGIA